MWQDKFEIKKELKAYWAAKETLFPIFSLKVTAAAHLMLNNKRKQENHSLLFTEILC